MQGPERTTNPTPADPPREGVWGAVGVGLLLVLFVLAVLATLHALLTTLG